MAEYDCACEVLASKKMFAFVYIKGMVGTYITYIARFLVPEDSSQALPAIMQGNAH